MASVEKARKLGVCNLCANHDGEKCMVRQTDNQECRLVDEMFNSKRMRIENMGDVTADMASLEINRAWREIADDNPDPMFEVGFWSCYRWIYGAPRTYFCEYCQRQSYPDYGRCAYCGKTNTEEG